jgi:hypothetical protein
MCSKLTSGQSAGIGFGIDAFGKLLGYGEERKDVARYNKAVAQQNQLRINAYNTKNRNEENIWRNSKIDSDIAVDNKWRETKDALAEAQLRAREVAGKALLSQQKILAKMLSRGSREQAGRRTGRGNIAALGAQFAEAGAAAAFARDSEILFKDKAGRNLSAFAQGKYVEYITGRPSPEAPPLMQEYRSQPSFLNTALSIAGSGLNRYNQYQENKLETPLIDNPNIYTQPVKPQPLPFLPDEAVGGLQPITPPVFNNNPFLQDDLDEFINFKRSSEAGKSLGFGNFNTFGIGN